jgi:hypothetical protein
MEVAVAVGLGAAVGVEGMASVGAIVGATATEMSAVDGSTDAFAPVQPADVRQKVIKTTEIRSYLISIIASRRSVDEHFSCLDVAT